jgi:hypothetical protein
MFVAVSLLHCSNPQHLTGRTRPDPSRITLHVDGTPALATMRSITSASSECSARPVWMPCEPSAHIAGLPKIFHSNVHSDTCCIDVARSAVLSLQRALRRREHCRAS